MIELEELDPECFQWENHELDVGVILDLSYNVFSKIPECEDSELHAALRKYAVGWCRSERLSIRPAKGFIAIMCEKDGERFWFHILDSTFQKVFGES